MFVVRTRRPGDPERCSQCNKAFGNYVLEAKNGDSISFCDFCMRRLKEEIDRYAEQII